jgi:glycosyltransferase involved in cell wall biosynthesis
MGFYVTDIQILRDCGYEVVPTNKVADFFQFRNYDVAFIYFWTRGLLPALISKCFRKKVLFTGGIDSLDRPYNRSTFDYTLKKWLFKGCAFLSDANIAVSRSDLQNMGNTGFRMQNIHLIPHAIDAERYAYSGTQKKDTITTVAWMGTKENVVRKGVDRLLEVFQKFAATDDRFTLILIGPEGEGSAYLKDMAARMNIAPRVIFPGVVPEDEKIRLLKESKYYFQLSEYEGFGVSAIEALAAGNLVFHSGKGGLADSMTPDGILVDDIDDFEAIAHRLREVDQRYTDYQARIDRGVRRMKNDYAYGKRNAEIGRILKALEH